MQQYSVCPGCGRLVRTGYPFLHQSGRTAMVFCLASCFVTWHREQQWRRHHTPTNPVYGERQAALPAGASDDRWPRRPAPADTVHT